MAKRGRNLTEGNIRKQLVSLTWPMLMGMMGMVIFNLVDTFYVGKLGVHELAAMSFSFPVVMFLNSLSQGVGIGTSSLISRNILHRERSEVGQIASRALLLGVIIVLIVAVIGSFTIRPVFSALGAEGVILDYVQDYMQIWYIGVPFVVIPMIGNNIIRATGDTFTPGMIMVVIAMINVVLDPFLIFGIGPFPRMGIQGAALSTVIARSMGLIGTSFILIKREKLLTIQFGLIKDILSTWKRVFYIAGPASLTLLITPVSVAFLTKILSGFGKEAVAAFGVSTRVEMFALMVIMAMGSVLIIFVGQNLSKHKFERIKKGLYYASRFSMLWGTFIFALLLLFGKFIAATFIDDPKVIEIATKYFIIIGASYGFQGLVILSTSSFNGLNKPYPATIFSVIRMLVLYVPLAWAGSRLIGIHGVFWAGLIANVAVGISAYFYLKGTIHRLEA